MYEQLTLDYVLTLAACVGVLLATILARSYFCFDHPRLPPGLSAFSTFVRFAKLALQKKDILLGITSEKEYGDIFCFRVPKLAILLSSNDLIHEVFVRQGDKCSLLHHGDPGSNRNPIWILTDGRGLFDSDGRWQPQRKLILSVFRDKGVGKRPMEEEILTESRLLTQALRDSAAEPMDARRLLAQAVSNVTSQIVFGNRFDYSDGQLKILDFDDFMWASYLTSYLPILTYLPGDLFGLKEARKRAELGVEFARQQIAEHKTTLDTDNPRDFIDRYLIEMRRDPSPDSVYTDKNLLSVVMGQYVAGTDTTSASLAWAFLYLLLYPQTQSIIHVEIERVVGDREIRNSDREDMPYTMSFVTEVLRIAIAVMSLPHFASEDIHVSDYVIPKGSLVVANLWRNCRDEKVFPDPDTFRPERFLDDSGNYIRPDARYLLPFGVGRRSCPGERLAQTELFIFLVATLRDFELKSGQKEPLSARGKRVMVYEPPPYLIRFIPRH